MSEHPIEGLMTTAMNSIQDMVDVNTIIGEPIETTNGIVIIPISKVSFGFAAGGGEPHLPPCGGQVRGPARHLGVLRRHCGQRPGRHRRYAAGRAGVRRDL